MAEVSTERYLDAVNAASGQARAMWLGFLGLIAYLLVAIAGVTHKDLLLNSPITLPIVNVKIPLFSFFIIAPILFVLVHLGLLVQHAMLSQKIQRFLESLGDYVDWGPGPDEIRSRLHAYTQTQLLAGPDRSAILGIFLHIMSWVTIYALPILLLLNFQLKFLPYHQVWVTAGHSAVLIIDILIVILIGLFIARPSAKFRDSFTQVIKTKWLLSVLVALVTPVIFYLSVFVMTVPDADEGEGMDHYRKHPPAGLAWAFAPANWLTELLFIPNEFREARKLQPFWKISRNLIVLNTDLVPDKQWEPDEPSHFLRERDFRFAILDRADLHRADLSESDLGGSSMLGTRLEKAILSRANLQGGDLRGAKLQGAVLQYAKLQGANLIGAELQGADLRGAQLQGAKLFRANLQGANLSGAELQGANLFGAGLQGAILTQANLQGANLSRAELQGAKLFGAELQGADLRGAKLQGADLRKAELQGAFLAKAELQGADLSRAELQGADLSRAKLQGADLRKAGIWRTRPPDEAAFHLADLADARIAPLPHEDYERLRALIDQGANKEWGQRLKDRLEPLLKGEPATDWDEEMQAWKELLARPGPDSTELSGFLGNLACADDAGGSLAKGIARRGLNKSYGSNHGDRAVLARALTMKTCRGAAKLDEGKTTQLCTLAAWPEDEIGKSVCASGP